jgi:RNA polymerase I-specific transcription initiation factor RRN3
MPARTAADTGKSGTMATPLKSALKRTASDMEDVEDTQAQTQRKRCKVQFNEADNKTELFWNDKAYPLVREEVRRAIENHLAGDSAAYASLKALLTTKPTDDDAPSPILLKRYITALDSFSHLMGKACGGLVTAVLDCSWLGRDDEFLIAYRRLLANLISSYGGNTIFVLESLVEKFVNSKHLTVNSEK